MSQRGECRLLKGSDIPAEAGHFAGCMRSRRPFRAFAAIARASPRARLIRRPVTLSQP